MVLPLTLLLILAFLWLTHRITLTRRSEMDLVEDKSVLKIAAELGEHQTASPLSSASELKRKHPGWDFAVFDRGQFIGATLQLSEHAQQIVGALPCRNHATSSRDHLMSFSSGEISSADWYWISKLTVPNWPEHLHLVMLYSSEYAENLDDRIEWQDELVGGFLIVLVLIVAISYSTQLSRRIVRIQHQVKQIADGATDQAADERGQDEISELARSVNHMAADLEKMKQQAKYTERLRVHAQLAAGVAHELRNGIHASKLALEMFEDACERSAVVIPASTMIRHAHTQLTMTESLVRRLLSVEKPSQRQLVPQALSDLLTDVCEVMLPICQHAQIEWESDIDPCLDWGASDSESMYSAIINLCLNAQAAAGRYGHVCLRATRNEFGIQVEVSDSGDGPAPHIAEVMFSPFVTTKPEGIGLGLVLVQQAVIAAGGEVSWKRASASTVFTVQLPSQRNKSVGENGSEAGPGQSAEEMFESPSLMNG